MTPPNQPEPINVTVTSLVDLPPASLEGFRLLLQRLISFANIPDLAHLGGILIVKEDGIADIVNALLQHDDDSAVPYTPSHEMKGAAVPVMRDGNLHCFILIAESEVRPLSPERYLVNPVNSTLLEELFHVRVYSGLLPSIAASTLMRGVGSQDVLLTLCTDALGEYLTNRWKTHLLSSYPLTAVDGGYSPIALYYPEALGMTLDQAGANIRSIITQVSNHTKPYDQGWLELLSTIYRGVIEPLARERAYRDGTALESPPVIDPPVETSQFYTQDVRPYWDDLLRAMRHAADTFDADPQERIAVVVSMRDTLLGFLNHLGVEYQVLPDNRIHVQFHGGQIDL